MNDDTKNTNPQPNDPTPGDDGGQGSEKVFTQEEVNRIVQDRLAKERAKQAPTEREQELTARESRLSCREYLAESRAPAVLLDVLDTSDLDKFKAAVEKLREAQSGLSTGISHGSSSWGARPMKTGLSHQGGHEVGGGLDDQISDAFRFKRR